MKLDAEYGTRYIDRVNPTEEDLNSINLADGQKLSENLVELQKTYLAAQRGELDPEKSLEILRKLNWPGI